MATVREAVVDCGGGFQHNDGWLELREASPMNMCLY